jgi:hypothetical protein
MFSVLFSPCAYWPACPCHLAFLAAGGNTAAAKAAKKQAKSAAKQDKKNARLKEQRAAEAAAGGKKVVPALQSETEAFSKAIKGVKSRARALMQQQGMTAKVAQKIAAKAVTGGRGCSVWWRTCFWFGHKAASLCFCSPILLYCRVSFVFVGHENACCSVLRLVLLASLAEALCRCAAGVSTSREKKKRKTGAGLFSGDGISKADDGGAAGAGKGSSSGGSKGGKDGKAKSSLSKSELNRVKRGGKGKSSFKSKKKFKRR